MIISHCAHYFQSAKADDNTSPEELPDELKLSEIEIRELLKELDATMEYLFLKENYANYLAMGGVAHAGVAGVLAANPVMTPAMLQAFVNNVTALALLGIVIERSRWDNIAQRVFDPDAYFENTHIQTGSRLSNVFVNFTKLDEWGTNVVNFLGILDEPVGYEEGRQIYIEGWELINNWFHDTFFTKSGFDFLYEDSASEIVLPEINLSDFAAMAVDAGVLESKLTNNKSGATEYWLHLPIGYAFITHEEIFVNGELRRVNISSSTSTARYEDEIRITVEEFDNSTNHMKRFESRPYNLINIARNINEYRYQTSSWNFYPWVGYSPGIGLPFLRFYDSMDRNEYEQDTAKRGLWNGSHPQSYRDFGLQNASQDDILSWNYELAVDEFFRVSYYDSIIARGVSDNLFSIPELPISFGGQDFCVIINDLRNQGLLPAFTGAASSEQGGPEKSGLPISIPEQDMSIANFEDRITDWLKNIAPAHIVAGTDGNPAISLDVGTATEGVFSGENEYEEMRRRLREVQQKLKEMQDAGYEVGTAGKMMEQLDDSLDRRRAAGLPIPVYSRRGIDELLGDIEGGIKTWTDTGVFNPAIPIEIEAAIPIILDGLDTPPPPGGGGHNPPGKAAPPPASFAMFPFCIPWDIATFINNLIATPIEPVFEARPFEHLGIDSVIRIDFSLFQDVLEIFRWGMRIMFVLVLIIVSRKYIWTGGG